STAASLRVSAASCRHFWHSSPPSGTSTPHTLHLGIERRVFFAHSTPPAARSTVTTVTPIHRPNGREVAPAEGDAGMATAALAGGDGLGLASTGAGCAARQRSRKEASWPFRQARY